MNIYIGDGGRIRGRIRQHSNGNIEGSSLRKHVARSMGYEIIQELRANGSKRSVLDLPDPSIGEQTISSYLQSGRWMYVICASREEAKDFQFYLIQNINPSPLLNVNRGSWSLNKVNRYIELSELIRNCEPLNFDRFNLIPNGPGVYLFINDLTPDQFIPAQPQLLIN